MAHSVSGMSAYCQVNTESSVDQFLYDGTYFSVAVNVNVKQGKWKPFVQHWFYLQGAQ